MPPWSGMRRTFVPASTRNPIAIDTPELSSDPDNVPPRSRLFVVVPKQADPQEIKVSHSSQ